MTRILSRSLPAFAIALFVFSIANVHSQIATADCNGCGSCSGASSGCNSTGGCYTGAGWSHIGGRCIGCGRGGCRGGCGIGLFGSSRFRGAGLGVGGLRGHCGLGGGLCGRLGGGGLASRCGLGGSGCRIPSYWNTLNGVGGICRTQQPQRPDLFYNYYAPTNCGGEMANMYPTPYPVPRVAGQTYFTYQPFYPHEFMYHHHRTYHSYYNGGRGLTRTHAKWYSSPKYLFTNGFKNLFEIAR